MAHERPTASDEQPGFASLGAHAPDSRVRIRPQAPVPAQRAPLAPGEFKALGRLVEHGAVPLHVVLARLR